jgi:hypothetical protein
MHTPFDALNRDADADKDNPGTARTSESAGSDHVVDLTAVAVHIANREVLGAADNLEAFSVTP